MKSSHAALAVVGLALAGLWYAAGGPAAPHPTAQARVSEPVSHENLTVYFVHGPDEIPDAKIVTLQEAIDAGWAVVHETGDVNRLAVENLSSEYELFVQEGDMIRGGKQDRVFAVDMLVPPRSGPVPFPAHCVEAGRWTNRGGEAVTHFNKSDQFAVGNDLRYANAAGQQSEVWKNVKEQQDKLSASLNVKVNARESESSLQLALENPAVQVKVGEFERALRAAGEKRPDVVGVVFVLNGQVYGHEEYGSNALFRKAWPKLLKSAAANAVAEKTAKATPPAPGAREVERFLAFGGPAGPAVPAPAGGSDGVSNVNAISYGQLPTELFARLRGRVGREEMYHPTTVTEQGGMYRPATALVITGRNRVNPTNPAPDSAIMGGAGEGRIDVQRLRQIADSWSGQGPQDRTRVMEEVMRDLPPRYRQMVEEYFRQLARVNGQNTDDLTRAIDAIRREQIRDERRRAAENAANPGGNVPTGGRLVIEGNTTTTDRVLMNRVDPQNPQGRAPNGGWADPQLFASYNISGLGARVASPSPVNPQGNRLNVNRVDGAAGLVTESRDPARQNAVIHRSFIKK